MSQCDSVWSAPAHLKQTPAATQGWDEWEHQPEGKVSSGTINQPPAWHNWKARVLTHIYIWNKDKVRALPWVQQHS